VSYGVLGPYDPPFNNAIYNSCDSGIYKNGCWGDAHMVTGNTATILHSVITIAAIVATITCLSSPMNKLSIHTGVCKRFI